MSFSEIPDHPAAITPQWLTHVLHQHIVLPDDVHVISIELDDPGSAASYAGHVSRLLLRYDKTTPTTPTRLIAKFPAGERVIRRLFAPIFRAEARFYDELASDIPIATPQCYAVVHDAGYSRVLLFLEDLSTHSRIGDHDRGCTFSEAVTALSCLARLHAHYWNSPQFDQLTWLSRYDVRIRKNWLIYASAWIPFQVRFGSSTPRPTLRLMRTLWRYRARLTALTETSPISLQHGDFRLANLAFSEAGMYAFDWQAVRIGIPLFDVAWFMLTSMPIKQRRAEEDDLLTAYHDALRDSGVDNYPIDDLRLHYRLALTLTLPQIMVIGAFLRFDSNGRRLMGELLERADVAREDHRLDELLLGDEE